ncbi:M28 family peptidase [Acidobacteria bacterium AH-259-D05]|nr:M28 family peptidase [Acidobacteria bacterium AH-259-D05]
MSTSAQIDLIDGDNVMHHVEEIISHGPHPPGSDAQKQVGAYIANQLESYGLEVHTQTFHPATPLGRRDMTNIWGITQGTTESIIILASHYDSKYFESFSFVGANDSGSSTALVLELARILASENPTEYALWFVFFDGEEAFLDWTSADSLYGSREFVKMLKTRDLLHKIACLVLLDMVGEKDLVLRKDINSTAWLNTIIWDTASEMGHADIFRIRGSTGAQDDHIPFAREGIAVVDIIDLDYAYWHRREDTMDKLSVDNLKIVGNVVLGSLPAIGRYLGERR